MFKISITKKTDGIVDGGWEWKFINANRVNKTCNICGVFMTPGNKNVTFTKITRAGTNKMFNTLHTCDKLNCVLNQGAKLGIKLQEFESIRHYLKKI